MRFGTVGIYVLSAVVTACVLSGCWLSRGPSTESIRAAERLARVEPTSCVEAAAQVDTLRRAMGDYYDAVDMSFSEQQDQVDRLSDIIWNKLKRTVELDSTCLRAYLGLGDYAARWMFYDDTLIYEAKRWYALGLRYLPENLSLLAGLASVYEAENSVDSAISCYAKITEELPELQGVKHALARLETAKNVKEVFFGAPEESYLLLERKASYSIGEPLVAHLKLKGTGSCEMYDYYDDPDNPVLIDRILDSAFVDSVLGDLERAGFLALRNPFTTHDEWNMDFDYVMQWHLPFYQITLHLPRINHSICVYGLGTITGRNALADVPTITYIPEFNVRLKSIVMDRLAILGEMWERLFSLEVAMKAVDEEFGSRGPIWSSSGTYRYQAETDDFVRVSLKTCEVQWSTARQSDETTTQDSFERNVIFQVGDSLYALDARTGRRVYAAARDTLSYPYFDVDGGCLYVGSKSEDKCTLREFDFLNGEYLRTAECRGDVEAWLITEGRKAGDDEERTISRQFEQLIAYFQPKGSED